MLTAKRKNPKACNFIPITFSIVHKRSFYLNSTWDTFGPGKTICSPVTFPNSSSYSRMAYRRTCTWQSETRIKRKFEENRGKGKARERAKETDRD